MKQMVINFSEARRASDARIQARFERFHRQNPQVYCELVRLARQARAAGRQRIGIKMLWEVMRWHFWIQTKGEDFKLSNDFHSRYSRLIMSQESDLRDVFELRELRS